MQLKRVYQPTTKEKMSKSSECFFNHVWRVVAPCIGGGELIPVEAVTDDKMRKLLDVNAGIDAWWLRGNGDISGIASRVQYPRDNWHNYPFNTFTIRTALASGNDTELQKRNRALQSNGAVLYPFLTVQAYMDTSHKKVLSVGIMRTVDLIASATEHKWRDVKVQGGNTMRVLSWDRLAMLGYNVKVLTP